MKGKINEQFRKFVELLKNIHINIPFTEAITLMPSYAKFLKKIWSNKRKLNDTSTMSLKEECSTITKNKLSLKMKDLGSFSFPYVIGKTVIGKILCDLRASASLYLFQFVKDSILVKLNP